MPSSFSILLNNSVPFRARNINGDGTEYAPTHTLVDKDGALIDVPAGLPIRGSYPISKTATIASGAAVSGVVDLAGCLLSGFIMPAAWTAAVLTLDVSVDGTNLFPVFQTTSTTETELSYAVTINRAYPVDSSLFIGVRYVRLRSGLVAAAVNQAQARAITLLTAQ
jgi:hypothetical protein